MNNIRTVNGYEIKPNADLEGADLESADLEGANLNGANLKNANLESANLISANLNNANLDSANLDDASLDGATLINATLENTLLRGAKLVGSSLTNANLKNADLNLAELINSELNRANLKNANLEEAIIDSTNLEEANLQDAKLMATDLTMTNFKGADLRNANFGDATMEHINLKRANLEEASLEGATLDNMHLKDTNLKNVNFSYAKLWNVDFTDAINFDSIILDETEMIKCTPPVGFILYNTSNGNEMRNPQDNATPLTELIRNEDNYNFAMENRNNATTNDVNIKTKYNEHSQLPLESNNPLTFKKTNMAYDSYENTQVSIGDYLNEPNTEDEGRFILHLNGQYICQSLKISRNMSEYDSLNPTDLNEFFECKDNAPSSWQGNTYIREWLKENGRGPLVKILGPGGTIYLVDKPSFFWDKPIPGSKVFNMVAIPEKIQKYVSSFILPVRPNFNVLGADHCNQLSPETIYHLELMVEKEKTPEKQRKKFNRKITIKKNIKIKSSNKKTTNKNKGGEKNITKKIKSKKKKSITHKK